jgi:hypothetical protein
MCSYSDRSQALLNQRRREASHPRDRLVLKIIGPANGGIERGSVVSGGIVRAGIVRAGIVGAGSVSESVWPGHLLTRRMREARQARNQQAI